MTSRALLLVEPHPLVGRALVRLFGERYCVAWATDLDSARSALLRSEYDVVMAAALYDAEELLRTVMKTQPRALRFVYADVVEYAAALRHYCHVVIQSPVRVGKLLDEIATLGS